MLGAQGPGVDDLSAAPSRGSADADADADADAANDVIAVHVHVYGQTGAFSDGPRLARRASLTEVVASCSEVRRVTSEGRLDWNGGSIESIPGT